MIIGAHTHNHIWLGNSSINEQQKEIELSVRFLNFFNVNKNHRVFCYPFGSYNKNTIQILKKIDLSLHSTRKMKWQILERNLKLQEKILTIFYLLENIGSFLITVAFK